MMIMMMIIASPKAAPAPIATVTYHRLTSINKRIHIPATGIGASVAAVME